MLRYYNQIVSDGLTYSIDKLIIKGSFNRFVSVETFPGQFMQVPFAYRFQELLLQNDDLCTVRHFDNFSSLKYRDSWRVDFGNDAVAYFALGFNGCANSDLSRWKIEFNPNKMLPNSFMDTLVQYCCRNSSSPYVASFDLAVDVPAPREDFFLVKDQRKYSVVMTSVSDKTEYLGVRHEMGYCKLYNKQREADLPAPLTRFELTIAVDNAECAFSFHDLVSRVPEIYYYTSYQLDHDEVALSGTDRILLEYALQNPLVWSMFGRSSRLKKERLMHLMEHHIKRLELNKDVLVKLYQWVINYV